MLDSQGQPAKCIRSHIASWRGGEEVAEYVGILQDPNLPFCCLLSAGYGHMRGCDTSVGHITGKICWGVKSVSDHWIRAHLATCEGLHTYQPKSCTKCSPTLQMTANYKRYMAMSQVRNRSNA